MIPIAELGLDGMITDQDADDDIELFRPLALASRIEKGSQEQKNKKKRGREKERKNHTSGDLVPPSVSNVSDASPVPCSLAYSNDMTEFHTGRAD